MIEYLRGEIASLSPTNMVMDCGGVGYDLSISLTTYSAYQGKESGKVWVSEVLREDAHLLYGFASRDERTLFLRLTSVSGVGPNTARLILSAYPPGELTAIITMGQQDALKSVKGIGLKTAQRIIVDLKGKLQIDDFPGDSTSSDLPGNPPPATIGTRLSMQNEALAALKMLGFQEVAVRKILTPLIEGNPDIRVEDLIKQALRCL